MKSYILLTLLIISCVFDKKPLDPNSMTNFDENYLETITDVRDNQTYRIVTIGSQTWMAENLNYTTEHSSYCWENLYAECIIHGRLYEVKKEFGFDIEFDRDSAMTNQKYALQRICPSGWRIPSSKDFLMLETFVAEENDLDKFDGKSNVKYANVAPYLKSKHMWAGSGNDMYQFNAMPSGTMEGHNAFTGRHQSSRYGDKTYFWTTTQAGNSEEYQSIQLASGLNSLGQSNMDIESNVSENGYSVRCIQDDGFVFQLNIDEYTLNLPEIPGLDEYTSTISIDDLDDAHWVNLANTPQFSDLSKSGVTLYQASGTNGNTLLTFNEYTESIAYVGSHTNSKVFQLVGTEWHEIDLTRIKKFDGHLSFKHLALSPKNKLYGLREVTNGYTRASEISVMVLNNNIWQFVGNQNLTKEYSYFESHLLFTPDGTPYVFADEGPGDAPSSDITAYRVYTLVKNNWELIHETENKVDEPFFLGLNSKLYDIEYHDSRTKSILYNISDDNNDYPIFDGVIISAAVGANGIPFIAARVTHDNPIQLYTLSDNKWTKFSDLSFEYSIGNKLVLTTEGELMFARCEDTVELYVFNTTSLQLIYERVVDTGCGDFWSFEFEVTSGGNPIIGIKNNEIYKSIYLKGLFVE
ncbi:MAG: hypothetical protein OCD01_05270 [Fibrobacterales bacterium]